MFTTRPRMKYRLENAEEMLAFIARIFDMGYTAAAQHNHNNETPDFEHYEAYIGSVTSDYFPVLHHLADMTDDVTKLLAVAKFRASFQAGYLEYWRNQNCSYVYLSDSTKGEQAKIFLDPATRSYGYIIVSAEEYGTFESEAVVGFASFNEALSAAQYNYKETVGE